MQFDKLITSEHKLMNLHIKETIEYKDLILLNVKRDFSTRYKQTILGPLWAIIQPLLTTIVFMVVFGKLAGLPASDVQEGYVIPGILFYMAGNICWSYFADTINMTSNTFLANKNVMEKVYYPRLVSPVSTALSNLISFSIQFVLLSVFWIYFKVKGGTDICLTPMILFIPILIIQMGMFSVGGGIVISSVTTKYRDLAMLVGFGLQLWQYATPVAYGYCLVENQSSWIQNLYMLNPMVSIITAFRYACFGSGYFNLMYYMIGWGITIFVFFIGLVLFSKIERTFTDTI